MRALLRCRLGAAAARKAGAVVSSEALAAARRGVACQALHTAHGTRSAGTAPPPPLSWALLAAAGGAAAAAAALGCDSGELRPGVALCADVGARHDVKVTTYNVLAPKLSDPKHFPKCPSGTTEHEARLPKIMARLEDETASGAVIALQEVDLLWAGKLHTFFAERGYVAVFAQYGKPFNGYMGVMMAWPREQYETLDVEISRISETAPKGTYPKSENNNSNLSSFGMLTYKGLKEVLGCPPPESQHKNENFEWNLAQNRMNEAVFVRLRPRGQPQLPSFCVSTYHMPCLFGPPEKVRVVNIHTFLLLKHLKDFAGSDPAVLMGDFNFKPGESPYLLASSGGSFEAAKASAAIPEELQGLKERLPEKAPWPQGLGSAYQNFHSKEPPFTNFAQTNGQDEPFVETLDYIWYTQDRLSVVECPQLPQTRQEVKGPFPNVAEPSDHLPIRATLRLQSGEIAAAAPRSKL